MIAAAVAVGALLIGWRGWRRRRAAAGAADAARALPSLATDVARSIRSGASLPLALEEQAARSDGPAGAELAAVVGSVHRGTSIDDALATWQATSRIAGVDLLAGACRFAVRQGGDLAPALDGVAGSLLDRLEVADEERALLSQARTSVVVLLALPPLGAVAFAVADPRVADVLLGSRVGSICVVTAAALDALGAWTAGRMVRAARR